jgi:hypothetical protein
MKLFEIIPQNLFSILASRNREIYVEALFVLRKAFKQEMSISKADLVAMLVANLDEMMVEMDLSEEDDAGEDGIAAGGKEGTGLSAAAHFILRRFRGTGWIELEYQVDSFEENVTLPDYAVKLINLLYSLTDESISEYNSYVYSAYSDLKLADQERDDYMYTALVSAYDKTIQLVDELKTLHNNIRRYHQSLNEYVTVNEVLQGHFDEYRNLIVDRIYHPLKTLDSVPRFKTPILRILGGWLADHPLRERMSNQAVLRGKHRTREEAGEDIILKIGEIMDIYERLDEMLEEIDRKNSAYTRASIEKMRYLLNSDRSIKGKIVELLTRVAASGGERRANLVERLRDTVEVYRQGDGDEKSLYVRAARDRRAEGSPLEVPAAEADAGEEALAEFMDRAKRSYSHARVMSFMQNAMAGLDVLTSREIPLPDDEAFILLLLASLKGGDRNVFYRVEFLEGYLDNNGYRIPTMRFVRKEIRNVDGIA